MLSHQSSITPLNDHRAPVWIVLAVWLLAMSLLAFAVRRYWPGTPFNSRFISDDASPLSADMQVARSVTTIAFGVGIMLIAAHIIFALFVVPVFENMFASVNLFLPEPTRTMMALSRGRLLAPSYLALDATVLLLWFRFGRPTWVQLFLVLGAVFAVITIGSVVTIYLPIMGMINAVQ